MEIQSYNLQGAELHLYTVKIQSTFLAIINYVLTVYKDSSNVKGSNKHLKTNRIDETPRITSGDSKNIKYVFSNYKVLTICFIVFAALLKKNNS